MFEVVADDGLISSASDHTMNMFVPHLLFGYACMNFFSYLSCDLALLRGKVGCRPGAFVLYYPCRYLSLLSMVTLLVYYDSSQKPELEFLLCVSQAASALALGFALSILAARTCILYTNKYLSLSMQLVLLAMWGLILCNMEDVTQPGVPHLHVVSHASMGIMTASVPIIGLVLALFYVFVVAKHEHNYRVWDCFRMMWNTDCAEYALICIITVPSTVFYLLDISDSGSSHLVSIRMAPRLTGLLTPPSKALGYASFVTTVITAARIYRKMLHRHDRCPVNFCPVRIYRWLKEGAMFVAGKLGLKPQPSPSQAHPPNEAPQLGSQRASQSLALSILEGRPRQANNRVCLPAHSRSTYAHSSLYESRAS